MKYATLKQAGKIISLFEETPLEQIQAILESGLMADLRDGNIKDVKRDEFRRILGMKPFIPINTYSITVDYSLSLADMIKAGRYDWVNDDIVANHFPVSDNGKTEIEMHLVRFNRTIESEKAIAELDNMGLRPASIEELLALGAQCPDLQREFPIVALGSVWRPSGGCPPVPYLWFYSGKRGLRLRWFDDGWDDSYRFAAVRK